MQTQGNAEIGSTKRKFHLCGVPLIDSGLFYDIDDEVYSDKKKYNDISFPNRELKTIKKI